MKVFRCIVKIFVFCAIFFVLQFVIGKVLKCDYDSTARIMVHELHDESKIDILFLGGSHVYRGVDIGLINEKLGCPSFSVSTSAQPIDGSFALLKEAVKFHPEIKKVYFDMDYNFPLKSDFNKRQSFKEVYAISEYLDDSKIKFDLLKSATSPQYYLNSTLRIGVDRYSLNPKKNFNMLKAVVSGDYSSYKYPILKNAEYTGKGYIPNSGIQKNILFSKKVSNTKFQESKVSKDYVKTLRYMVEFCQQNNIEFVAISVPEPDYFAYSIENYDDYIVFVKSILGQYNCDYYDFNLCRRETLDLATVDFYDDNHLNKYGAEKFSTVLAKVLKNEIKFGDEKYFYPTVKEKVETEPEEIAGIYISESKDGRTMNLKTVSNKKEGSQILYDYIFIDSKKNETVLVEKTSNSYVGLPLETKGIIKVSCYLNGEFVCDVNKSFNTIWIK